MLGNRLSDLFIIFFPIEGICSNSDDVVTFSEAGKQQEEAKKKNNICTSD